MKIERLSDNKIKVTVYGDDIKMWNVDLKNFTDNTPEAQEMFMYVLEQARQDVDFHVGKAQLIVETVPSQDDGFVLIVSRVENEAELSAILMRAGKQLCQTEFRVRTSRRNLTALRIFEFGDFEDVCRGVCEIRGMYLGSSKLKKYQGSFYLELVPADNFSIFEVENILSEFSVKHKNPSVMQGVLNEHGKVMIESDAIGVIVKNFL